MKHASEELLQDPKFILQAVQTNGWAMKHIPEECELQCFYCKQRVQSLWLLAKLCVANAARNDREVVLAAVQQDGEMLRNASEELRSDRQFVLDLLKQGVNVLGHVSEELRNDEEVVLAAVQLCGGALEHASEEQQNDRKIVLVAVMQDGAALEHASQRLRNERHVVLAAVESSSTALPFPKPKPILPVCFNQSPFQYKR